MSVPTYPQLLFLQSAEGERGTTPSYSLITGAATFLRLPQASLINLSRQSAVLHSVGCSAGEKAYLAARQASSPQTRPSN
ncbi:hypothetical protein Cob_v000341 [Colletotrichum orbiculare MAFF 240422]|uniref:Uncharacterized protein n=1 Tax=Colletotrichum orbiculare (strain 104-T / ATCC 96160 / CBS 514.97 / LARS 414 / MAFF 240422) TaxID=1213857 RepID=A0A484G8B8_COLOR|nr:hypothetical protein Cob_v000341 [Colletotrichum orbiculare MAFF 240422]